MLIKAIIALVLSFVVSSVFAEIAVIGNPHLHFDSLSPEQVANIYLGKTAQFPDGSKVIPVDQGVGSPIRDDFYQQILQMNNTQLKSYWSRVIFTGKGRPPLQESEESRVKQLVASNPSLMGYIDKSQADSTVKVLLTVK